jgi:molybdopterin synthase sulfur carrier subunit
MADGSHRVASGVTINLVYLARLREAVGRGGERMTVTAGSSVGALLDALRARGEPWSRELAPGRAFRVARNHDIVDQDAILGAGDEVALLPPVTGG